MGTSCPAMFRSIRRDAGVPLVLRRAVLPKSQGKTRKSKMLLPMEVLAGDMARDIAVRRAGRRKARPWITRITVHGHADA